MSPHTASVVIDLVLVIGLVALVTAIVRDEIHSARECARMARERAALRASRSRDWWAE